MTATGRTIRPLLAAMLGVAGLTARADVLAQSIVVCNARRCWRGGWRARGASSTSSSFS